MGGLSGTVRDVYRPVQDLHGRPCGFQSSAAGMVPAGDAVQVEVPAEGGLGGQPSKEYLSCMSITALPLTYDSVSEHPHWSALHLRPPRPLGFRDEVPAQGLHRRPPSPDGGDHAGRREGLRVRDRRVQQRQQPRPPAREPPPRRPPRPSWSTARRASARAGSTRSTRNRSGTTDGRNGCGPAHTSPDRSAEPRCRPSVSTSSSRIVHCNLRVTAALRIASPPGKSPVHCDQSR